MKRTLLLIAVAIVICGNAWSQAVSQGKSIVDISYGWPNLWTSVFKGIATDATSTNVSTGTLGPIGIKYEYMVADKIGVGAIVNYATSSVKFDDVQDVYNSNTGLYDQVTYNYKLSVPRFRIMAKFAFHYGNSDAFDGYTNVAFGYGTFGIKQTTNDPNYNADDLNLKITPVAFRIATGGRYFFTDNIGAHLEFGIGGGGLIEFGLSARF